MEISIVYSDIMEPKSVTKMQSRGWDCDNRDDGKTYCGVDKPAEYSLSTFWEEISESICQIEQNSDPIVDIGVFIQNSSPMISISISNNFIKVLAEREIGLLVSTYVTS